MQPTTNQGLALNYSNPLADTWEIYEAKVPDYLDGKTEVTFAKRNANMWVAQADLTGVPPEFHDADIEKFGFASYKVNMEQIKKICKNFVMNFPYWMEKGKGIYLWSTTPGTGKTFLGCCLAKSAMIKNNLRMRFVTAPDYISLVIAGSKREMGAEDKSEIYRNCDLLVLDDLGAQTSGNWQQQELFRLINQRMENGGITIFTSNSPPEKLNLESRTIDRIIKMSIVLAMPEESIRREKAAKEQKEFLDNIL